MFATVTRTPAGVEPSGTKRSRKITRLPSRRQVLEAPPPSAATTVRCESDKLGEKSIDLLLGGRPWQVRLVDPQRQHADHCGTEVERHRECVTGRSHPVLHALLDGFRGPFQYRFLERHAGSSAGLAFVHDLVEARM